MAVRLSTAVNASPSCHMRVNPSTQTITPPASTYFVAQASAPRTRPQDACSVPAAASRIKSIGAPASANIRSTVMIAAA